MEKGLLLGIYWRLMDETQWVLMVMTAAVASPAAAAPGFHKSRYLILWMAAVSHPLL